MNEENIDMKATKVVKITMPITYANFFTEDCRLNYSDSYWLKVKFIDMVSSALLNQGDKDILQEFHNIRDELKKDIRGMYDAEMRRLRNIVKNGV